MHLPLRCCTLTTTFGLQLRAASMAARAANVVLAGTLGAFVPTSNHTTLCYAGCRFKFMVHPTGFLVHRQHSYSKAGTLYQASKKVYEKSVKEDKAKGDKDTSLAGTTHK